jgi:type II restriction enzyme
MDLCFDTSKAAGYKSGSQIARVLTESWARMNLYCVSCRADRLAPARENTRVVDFVCDKCREQYQLKSQGKPLGSKVADAAYAPMAEAIAHNRSPNFLFMHYSRDAKCVENLLLVPRHFVTLSCIEMRNPLSPKARRAGWQGCNILLGALPGDARIPLIHGGHAMSPRDVRKDYARFRFLSEQKANERGWLADVLKCVRDLGKEDFTLREVYEYEASLKRLHPANKNVRPKIRQQLQVLRDRGMLTFLSPGHYRLRV